jgi:hypothetical protein
MTRRGALRAATPPAAWSRACLQTLLATCLLACLAPLPSAAAGEPPRPFRARYEMRMNGLAVAQARLSLERLRDGRFVYRSESRPKGIVAWLRDDHVVERSLWSLADGAIRPHEYTYLHSGGGEQRRVDVVFDWTGRVVTNTADGKSWRMDLVDGTLDKLVYQLSLMRDLAAGRRDLAYPIADGGRLKTWRFEVVGEEVLDTPLGRLSTLRVKRFRERPRHRETELWCAPRLHYLPVRVDQARDEAGRGLSLRILEVEGLDDGAP